MSKVALVAAMDINRTIGFDGKLPFASDLEFFKNLTTGGSVVMGRKTWDSLPVKPLPKRENIVITRGGMHVMELRAQCREVVTAGSVAEAIEKAALPKVYVIGGAEIYKQALDNHLVDMLVLTLVDGIHEGDTFFPHIDGEWELFSKDFNNLGGLIRYWYRRVTPKKLP